MLSRNEGALKNLKGEIDSTSKKELFQGSVALYLMEPAVTGILGQTGSCIQIFEKLAAGGSVEWLYEQE